MITGLKSVLKGLKDARRRHAKGTEVGLKKCGTILLAASLKIVPRDIGNLAATGYVRHEGSGFRTVVYVGYTSEYAIYVHEDLELRHGADYNAWYGEEIAAGTKKDRGPDQQAKFLEQPAKTLRREFREIILEEVEGS